MVQSFQRQPAQTTRTVTGQPVEAVPEWWLELGGSRPEYWIYRAITRTGRLMEAGDFSYQVTKFGGLGIRGSFDVDFIVKSPYVGIEVQSLYFHNLKSKDRAHDALRRATLEADGLRVEFISEEEAINRPDAAVREALAGTRGKGPLGI